MTNNIVSAVIYLAKCVLAGHNVLSHAPQGEKEFELCHVNLKEQDEDAPSNI